MQENKFTHLHVHTEYSLLDGSAKIKELIAKCKELNMDSLAITDHGVMFGVIDFYKEAKAQGIKPILGCEVYIASGSRHNKLNTSDNFYYHLVLLAENNIGYHNLVKLVSYGFTEGFYHKPRIDLEILKEYKEGLIALSACLGGPVAKNLLNVSYEKAKQLALTYNEIMGEGNFFLELQDHGMQEQIKINPQLVRMSQETGIPLVCTNDSHYILEEDSVAHDILLCIQTQKTVNDEDRMRYDGNQFYLKSPEQMYALFPYAREAAENTQKIADRCDVSIKFNEYKLPKFKISDEYKQYSPDEYLDLLCKAGLEKRYKNPDESLQARMNEELTVIKNMGFVDYFLIVWDFIRYAREKDIIVGPGRGSAAGSIVAYSLGITNIDPIKYGLIFERFLNAERISMPDIDIDFCYERRQEVIDYVIEKYGYDHVAQIVTFGTMAAKAVVRDVGRALAMSYSDVDRVAKMIPFAIGITLKKALEMNPELLKAYAEEEDTKYLIDMSKKLEGLPRHSSTHAAGVVICNEPVMEHVPLNKNDEAITTQFPMNTLEELGLLKMDFLGLRTLTVIQNSVHEINRNNHLQLNIDDVSFDDPKVFELISQAKTEGVFQLESNGMKSFMKDLQPESLEDVIAGISLYRPGPMDFIPKYISGKRNASNVSYVHESLRKILEPTYGCIVYQEQVMQIVRELAGYSLGRSDLMRRAMSKKKHDVMEKERTGFLEGCVKNNIPQDAANKIFDDMAGFAAYAFNKSHAAAYAVLGYQTAWLKIYYPVEFMAALMTSVMDWSAKVAEYIFECKKMDIKLLPPDINDGFGYFSVSGKAIRFGLLAIKNVGRPTVAAIVEERAKNGKFTSMSEFITRMDSRDLNKRCIESLIKAGAFDSFGGRRAQYMAIYKNIIDGIGFTKKRNVAGQINLFEMFNDESVVQKDDLPNISEYPMRQMLEYEKEVLGIYVSGHPLAEHEKFLSKYINATSLDFILNDDGTHGVYDEKQVSVGGIITSKSVKYTKNNQAMAFLMIEDIYGVLEIIIFPKTYEKYLGRLENDAIIIVNGRASVKEDEDAKVICNDIILRQSTVNYNLFLKIGSDTQNTPLAITEILKPFKGDIPVIIYEEAEKKKYTLHEKYNVCNNDELIRRLRLLLGDNSVVLKEVEEK